MVIDLRGIEKVTNEKYIPYYNGTKRYEVFYGGAGSGKSRFVGQKIIYKILLEKGHKILVIRKVANTLRNSCFSLINSYINSWGLSDFFKINKSDMSIICTINNNEILFKGIDDPEKIKSIDGITCIWIEEASELSFDDFTQLDLRLRGITENPKQIMISFNPISAEHWLKKRFFDKECEDTSILKTTYLDNRFLDDVYKKTLEDLKENNPSYYKIYCLGEWGNLEGLVYEKYKIVDKFPDDLQMVIYGVDFGFNDPTAIIKVGFYYNEVFIDEVFYKSGYTSGDVIDYLKREHFYLSKLIGFFETAEPDKIEEFKRAGFRVREAKKSIIDGINEVKKYRLNITKNSVNVIREIQNYTWDKDKNGKIQDKPIDSYNHAMDAMRYAIYTSAKPQNPQSSLYNYQKIEGAW